MTPCIQGHAWDAGPEKKHLDQVDFWAAIGRYLTGPMSLPLTWHPSGLTALAFWIAGIGSGAASRLPVKILAFPLVRAMAQQWQQGLTAFSGKDKKKTCNPSLLSSLPVIQLLHPPPHHHQRLCGRVMDNFHPTRGVSPETQALPET